ncbi:MAG: hypothetical protein FWD11_07335, partial [Micrococcales bacterium]|nr:hypothetical protein [Micrococcales bacterium]
MKKKLSVPVAAAAASTLVVTTALLTGSTTALWTQTTPLALSDASITYEYPEDDEDLATYDLKTSISANRTIVPGLGTTPDSYPTTLTYTVRVDNLGPEDTGKTTITVDVPLSDGLVFDSVSAPGATCDTSKAGLSQGTVTTANKGIAHGYGRIVCTVPTIMVDDYYQLSIDMVASKALVHAELVATATATAAGDTDLSNNTASWLLSSPNALIDLSLRKSGPASIQAGNRGTYTLTVKNNLIGSEGAVASPPTVEDTLPAGV